MILYTPMQLELVLEGFDTAEYPDFEEVTFKGVPLLVERDGRGRQKIVRLLSTDPFDYLKPELSPGSLIEC
ncbi:MAG: YlzJ-like family protein [Peptococcaceae bacterium]|nr:YlzJ-like family protein [Peptococcaceae bacterium]